MSHQSDLIATDIHAYLAQHERKELLRFLTCGSVDDGKSTLIGRLLHDSKMIYEDQLAAVRRDSARHGTTGEEVDLALLVDGLRAEREQGITIDVAYRYFSTARRKFIIADTPGHEQYTRNMATGASTCDLAVILIDARHGVLTQTKRHSFIVSLLGIRHVVVAINKMDLVDFSEEVFERIKVDYKNFAGRLNIPEIRFIPLSALKGDNVVEPSRAMPWYHGPALMELLETIDISADRNFTDFRLPVQYVNRPHPEFRGFSGTVASGVVRPGDEVAVLPSGKRSRVRRIVTYDGDLDEAYPPMAVTLTLEDEIDVSRGDMLVHPDDQPHIGHELEAVVVWMAEEPMLPGKEYLIKHCSRVVPASVSTLRYQVNVNTLDREHSPTLGLNEIGRCTLTLREYVPWDPYRRNRQTGAFIVIDRITNGTIGAGMLIDPTRSDGTYPWDYWDTTTRARHGAAGVDGVTVQERAARFGQRPGTMLLTGLTGAGKTTIARALERRLFDLGRVCTVVDAESLRRGISRDLGITATDRVENLRRASEVARLLNEAGAICLLPFVAENAEARARAKAALGSDRFIEIYLSAPLDVCRMRDAEGVYEQAEQGIIPDFPGVTAPYEPPHNPDLTLATDTLSVEDCVSRIVALLDSRGWLSANPRPDVSGTYDYSI